MTDEQIALARRAVACSGFRWLPGMLASSPSSPYEMHRVISSGLGCTHLTTGRYQAGGVVEQSGPMANGLLPDLTDLATLGCLLALVREAWGDPGMFVRPRGSKMRPDWAVFTGQNSDLVCAASKEVEALVAALEAAPNTGGEHRREEEP